MQALCVRVCGPAIDLHALAEVGSRPTLRKTLTATVARPSTVSSRLFVAKKAFTFSICAAMATTGPLVAPGLLLPLGVSTAS